MLTMYSTQYKTEICRVSDLTASPHLKCSRLGTRPSGYLVLAHTGSVAVSYILSCQQMVQLQELKAFLPQRSTKRVAGPTATRTTHLFLSCSESLPSAIRKPRLQLRLPQLPRKHTSHHRVPELALSELIHHRSINPP